MANIFTTSGTGMPVNGELISAINSQAGTKIWAAYYTPGLWKSDDEAINYQKALPRFDINEEANFSPFTKELVSHFKIAGEDGKKVPAYFTTTKEVIDEETGDYKLVVDRFTISPEEWLAEDQTSLGTKLAKLTTDPQTKISLKEAAEGEEEVEGVNYIMVDNEPAIFENPMSEGSTFKVTYVPTLSEDAEGENNEGETFQVQPENGIDGQSEEGDETEETEESETPAETVEIEVETVDELVRRFGNVPYKIEVTAPEMLSALADLIPSLNEENYKGKKEDDVEADGVLKLNGGQDAVSGITIFIKNRDKVTQIDPASFVKDGYTTIITTDLTTHFEIVYNLLYCERPYDGAPLNYRVDTYSEKIRLDWKNK